MSHAEAFRVAGVVIAVRSNGTYQARLENGHELVAFVGGRSRDTVKFARGDRVWLQLTPFDLSTGRILTKAD